MVIEHTELRITALDIARPGALEQIRSYFRDDRDIGAYALAYMNPLRINRGDFYQKFLNSSQSFRAHSKESRLQKPDIWRPRVLIMKRC